MHRIARTLALLNGWQRAWVLIAAVGFLGMLACGFYSFPTLGRQESKVFEVSRQISSVRLIQSPSSGKPMLARGVAVCGVSTI